MMKPTLSDGFDEHTQVRLPLIKRLGTFPKPTSESVMHESSLDHLLKGIFNRHGTGFGLRRRLGDFDLGRGRIGGGVGASVRHFG